MLALSFQDDVEYTLFVAVKRFLFVALLIQFCARLSRSVDPGRFWTLGLLVLLGIYNPFWPVHFGSPWPWRLMDIVTMVVSFLAWSNLYDSRPAPPPAERLPDTEA